MNFKLNLTAQQLEEIRQQIENKSKIVSYTNKIIIDNNSMIFPSKSSIILDSTYVFDEGVISKIEYIEDENNLYILYDAFDNAVMYLPDTDNRYLVINDVGDNSFNIELQESINIDKAIYPVFSREIEYVNGINKGKLYARFSPITPEDKYTVCTTSGSTNYINSIFDVFEEDSEYSMLFNYLGLGIGDTLIKISKDLSCLDILMLYRLKDNYVELKSKSGETVLLSYNEMVQPTSTDNYIIAQDDFLVYDKRDDFLDVEFEEEIRNTIIEELYTLDNIDLKFSMFKEEMRLLLTSFSDENVLDVDTKEQWNAKISVCISISDKLSEMNVFKSFKGLVYIDKEGSISIIDNLDLFNSYIQEMLNFLA